MKRPLAVVLGAGGVLLLGLGLLFLLGSAGRPSRLAVAAVGLTVGGVLAGAGARLWLLADAASPEQLRAELLALARTRDGELSEADVEAGLGRRASGARPVLEELLSAGRVRRESREGRAVWVFPELQPRLLVLRCEYCGAELSITAAEDKCPRCGGTVERRVEARALPDGSYRMDE